MGAAEGHWPALGHFLRIPLSLAVGPGVGPGDLESSAGESWWALGPGWWGAASLGRVWKLGQGVLMHRIGVQEERAEGCGAATPAMAK